MAIAFDTALHQKVTTQTNTVSLTLGGSATLLIAYALVFPGETIPSVPTWNGTSMTQFGNVTSGGSGFVMYGWYLNNPTTGTHNLVGVRGTNSGNTFYFMGMSYSGAVWGGISNTAAGSWTSSPKSQTLTSTVDNSWMTTFVLDDSSGLSASTHSTVRSVILDGAVGGFDSNGVIHPAGSFSMSQTGTTGSASVAYSAVFGIIAPSAAAPSSFPDMRLAFL